MFSAQLRQAVEASPRSGLAHVSSLLWRAHAAGSIGGDDAQALAEMIEVRKALPPTEKPVQRRVGSRPRSPASMERRRRWASSGAMPPQVQSRFTLAEAAVLAVVAAEVRTKGSCGLTIGHIAALAGVCETTVRNALREAAALGFIRIEERRVSAWRNLPNRVTVTSPEWSAWMRLRRRGALGSHAPGCKLANPTPYKGKKGAPSAQRAADEGGFGRRWRERPGMKYPKE